MRIAGACATLPDSGRRRQGRRRPALFWRGQFPDRRWGEGSGLIRDVTDIGIPQSSEGKGHTFESCFSQDPDDLFFREPAPLHWSIPFRGDGLYSFLEEFAGLRSGLFQSCVRRCCAPSHFSATVKRMTQARGQTLAFTNQLG
jgi:hypothetical protein